MLKGKPPTFNNKLDAITTAGVTQKFLQDHKATIAHPEMNHYKKIVARVRAVRGLGEWLAVHERISEEAPFSCLQGSPPRCPSKSCTTIQAGFDCMFSLGFVLMFGLRSVNQNAAPGWVGHCPELVLEPGDI